MESIADRLVWLQNRMQLRLNEVEAEVLADAIAEARDLEESLPPPSRRLLEAHDEEPAPADIAAHTPSPAASPQSAQALHPWQRWRGPRLSPYKGGSR